MWCEVKFATQVSVCLEPFWLLRGLQNKRIHLHSSYPIATPGGSAATRIQAIVPVSTVHCQEQMDGCASQPPSMTCSEISWSIPTSFLERRTSKILISKMIWTWKCKPCKRYLQMMEDFLLISTGPLVLLEADSFLLGWTVISPLVTATLAQGKKQATDVRAKEARDFQSERPCSHFHWWQCLKFKHSTVPFLVHICSMWGLCRCNLYIFLNISPNLVPIFFLNISCSLGTHFGLRRISSWDAWNLRISMFSYVFHGKCGYAKWV